MRKAHFVTFDDYIPKNTNTASLAVFTSTEMANLLGRHNQLALHVLLDNITIASAQSFYLFLEHSSDAMNWIERANQTNNYSVGTPNDSDLTISLASGQPFAQAMWSDACQGKTNTGPMLPFVRLRMFFSSATVAAHVKIIATQRDQ